VFGPRLPRSAGYRRRHMLLILLAVPS